ncbi:hypothetical protein [Paenibacillus ihuae]|uniref:hypothetical protein n=1 Tax=Paenibacillus ihuae TaxID=1232431 RepID=UPI0006D5B28A|nr:hypothetical protein [Paenibacillus ihuae]
MSIIQETIQWIAHHTESIKNVHDTVVDELLRYGNVFVAYHQVREVNQEEKEKEEESNAPDQENNEDSSKK